MKQLLQVIFFLIIIAGAGFAGVWVGQNTLNNNHKNYNDIHSLLHEKLNITAQQELKIKDIEEKYILLKNSYKEQMRAANLELAEAIKDGDYESENIKIIVQKIHHAMGALQSLSLEHLAQIEKILSKEQSQKLKEMVVTQLKHNAGQ